MQKIIKPRSPSRQLLETVNFAFMKIFDSLVKIAVFMMLFHILMFVSNHELMLDNFLITSNVDGKLIVSKFNLQKGDLIRPGQVLFLLFLQISLFIYSNLGLRLATERN